MTLPAAPSSVERCERHPDRAAAGTCARCGSFACDSCFVPTSRRCERCVGIGEIPWEDEGAWLRRLGKTLVVLARRPGEALSDAAGLGSIPKSWAFGAIVFLLISVLGTGSALSVTLLGVGRLAAAGGLDRSAVAVLGSLLVLLLALAPLKLAALVVTHAVRAAVFALGVRLSGGRGRLREIAWLEGYLVVGAAPLGLVLLGAALVPDGRVLTVSLLAAVLTQEAWTAVTHRSFATRRLGLSTGAATAVAWAPVFLFTVAAWLSL